MKSKYFQKIILAFSGIVIIYASLIAFFYVHMQNQLNQTEAKRQAKSFLSEAASRIDNQLEIAFNVKEQLKRNEEIIALADHKELNYYNVLKVHKELSSHLDAFSRLGYMISIAKPDATMMITPQSTVEWGRYLRRYASEESAKQWENLPQQLSQMDKQVIALPTDEGGNLLYAGIERVGRRSNQLAFYLWFAGNNLMPQFEETRGQGFYILAKDKVLLASGEEREYDFLEKMLQEQDKTVDAVQLDNFLVCAQKSEVPEAGWVYVYVMDRGKDAARLKKLLQGALWLALPLLAGGLGLAFLLSRNIYRPVYEVVQTLEQGVTEKEIVNEWEYILNRNKEMQESARHFEETLSANQEKLKIQFLRELSLGLIPQEEFLHQLHSRILGNPNTPAVLAVLQYHLTEEMRRTLTADGSFELKKQILRWVQAELAKGLNFEMFEYNDRRAVFLIPDKPQPDIIRQMSEIVRQAEEMFKIRIWAIIGEPVSTLAEIPHSFQSLLNVMEYEFLWDNYTVVTERAIKALKNETYYYPLDMEKDLIDYVLQGKGAEVHNILNSIFEYNFEKKQLSPATLSKFIFAIVSTSNRILNHFSNLTLELNREKELSYIKLKMYHNQGELKQAIYELFDDLLRQSAEESEQRSVDIVDEIMAYLQENYDRDLSLNDIAEEFHLSAGYVGILFKKSSGENFKDYFNQYKIEKAKEILQQEEVKIKDLAERVGCNSTSSFIRIFKKYAGVSPGQYAESVREGKRDKK